MKLTKMLKKAGRTALILAMAVSLCGTTLCKAFATYVPYIVNVEHVFHDHKNGAEVETGEYSPRDNLIDGLGKDEDGEPGALNVEYGPSTTEGVSKEGGISLNGAETGGNVGWTDAGKVMQALLDRLDVDNADGDGESENEELKELKSELESIYKEYGEADAGKPEDIPDRPEGDEPPAIPDEPKAKVEAPEEPTAPERGEDESDEIFEARWAEYLEKFDEYSNAYEEYTADQARLEAEMANYKNAKEAYETWAEGKDSEELENWKIWEEYQQWEKGYLEKLQRVMGDLRTLVGEDCFEAVEMTDKNLLSGYEKTLLGAIMDCLYWEYDNENEGINDWEGVVEELRWGVEDLESYESSGLKIDTWKGVDGTAGEYADGTQNLFEFKAWLDESSKAALEAGRYTTGNDGNPTRITVICVKYKVEEVENDEGETVLKFVNADESAGTKTYISFDNGTTWYESSELNENGEPKDGAVGTATNDIQLGSGWVTNAVTFTFEHSWEPPTPDTPVYEGEKPVPEDLVPEESEKPEDPEPEVSETPDEPEPEVSETPEEPVEDPETPLGEPPEETEVDEPDVPLSDIPQTGDISGLWYAAALIAAVGLMGLLYQDRREKKND